MQFWYATPWAEESGGNDFTENFNIDLGGSYPVLVECWLNQVGQQGGGGNAYIQITGYVQNGQLNSGIWTQLNGNGISEIIGRLVVNNCRAFGVCRVLAIDE